jgi:hypothetical protein
MMRAAVQAMRCVNVRVREWGRQHWNETERKHTWINRNRQKHIHKSHYTKHEHIYIANTRHRSLNQHMDCVISLILLFMLRAISSAHVYMKSHLHPFIERPRIITWTQNIKYKLYGVWSEHSSNPHTVICLPSNLKRKIILHRPNNSRTRLTFADTYVFQMSIT